MSDQTERQDSDIPIHADTLIINLLVKEIKALRSVLSEWDTDKSCYLQMNRADELARAIEIIRECL